MLLHQVVTTEKVPFTYRVAGMGSRLLAWLIDVGFLVLLGFAGGCTFLVYNALRPGLGSGLLQLWLFVLSWSYFLLFEWLWRGQTPGKRLLGIRVIHRRGTTVTLFQSAVRNVVRWVDALPVFYALGFTVAVCNRQHLRLGDLAAGTLVVHVEAAPRAVALPEVAQAESALDREGQIRQRLTQLDRSQKQALVELCLRREQLRVRDRARLFTAVAQYFQERFGLVPEPYQSEEKFVVQLAVLVQER